MRNYIKRGGLSSRTLYSQLRQEVWNKIYDLDRKQNVIHDIDIQQIAMTTAKSMGLHEFKVGYQIIFNYVHHNQ